MRRLALTLAAGVLVLAVYAGVASAAVFNVTTTADAVDALAGDGVCADAAGNCTLRAAVQEANALPGFDNIMVPGGTFYLAVGGAGEDFAAKGDLDVRSELAVFGQGPRRTVIDPIHEDRAFDVFSTSAQISGLSIRNGRETAGAGMRVQSSKLYLKWVALYGNTAVRPPLWWVLAAGGGIASYDSWLTTNGVSVFRNTADDMGGGIYLYGTVGSNATTHLVNVTVDGNSARRGGGVFSHTSQTILHNLTISSNSAALGGGVYWLNIPPRSYDTTVAYNAGQDCNAGIASAANNNDTDTTCSFFGAFDLPGVDPLLGPLTYVPGPMPNWVRTLLAASPIRDAGDNATCSGNDEVGQARPIGPVCDIGAYEQP